MKFARNLPFLSEFPVSRSLAWDCHWPIRKESWKGLTRLVLRRTICCFYLSPLTILRHWFEEGIYGWLLFLLFCICLFHNIWPFINFRNVWTDLPLILILSVYIDFLTFKFGKIQIFPPKIKRNSFFCGLPNVFPYTVLIHTDFFLNNDFSCHLYWFCVRS